ncbi:hypothetical protein AB685_01325 [Bacillus sp. LL01]|uniref:DUF3231 family protein n=1 Tax=Bacillus sp. LL01 TaxID=1665556 RepID=UPI00064CE3A3|nr:DUF3231 family protein [Bacillus sp. LL01]KMJ59548.1 hypothetical protein AB685_01325 [Bacillus sp. LL01]
MDKQLTSSEVGNMWMTYQQKTMLARILEYFLANKQNEEIHSLIQTLYNQEIKFINEITELFQQEKFVVPVGYVESDVSPSTKPLYDQYFDALFLRVMMKLTIGLNALHVSMSYREDITQLFKRFFDVSQNTYNETTQFLLKEGVLTRPPMIPMPEKVEFIKGKGYMSGFNLFSEKRPLNAIELSLLYQGIETNVLGFQLLRGFEQVSEDKEVKAYFKKGKSLAKSVIETFSDTLLKSDIQPPVVAWGNPTLSTDSPFSEKLMMYLTSLLSSFGLTSNALGTSFSLRSDLPAKMTLIAKDIFDYAKEGGKLMIKNGWMEEPPQTIKNTKN